MEIDPPSTTSSEVTFPLGKCMGNPVDPIGSQISLYSPDNPPISSLISKEKTSGIAKVIESKVKKFDFSETFTVNNTSCKSTSIVMCNVLNYTGTSFLHCGVNNVQNGSFDIIVQVFLKRFS